jgi:hypothetical protein
MSTFCFDNYIHMIDEDLISCTSKSPEVYFESWDDPYEGLAPDEDSVIVVRDKYITKYTRLKCADNLAEPDNKEVPLGNDLMDHCENSSSLGKLKDIRDSYEYAVEEYDIETFKKRKYKVRFEEEAEISVEDYRTMSYFVGINKLSSHFDIKDGVLSRYLGNDRDLYIPDNVTEIAVGSFRGSEKFNCVVIPKTVIQIPCGFCWTEKLEVAKDNPKYYIQDGCLIDKEEKELVWAYSGSTIPDDGSVVKIGSNAFSYRYDLSRIVIPDAITEIGDDAFNSCYALNEIVLPDVFVEDSKRIFGRSLVKDGDVWSLTLPEVGFSF